MANIIEIQILNKDSLNTSNGFPVLKGNKIPDVIIAPLIEDLQIDCKSIFESIGDMVPFLKDVVGTITSVTAGLSGGISEGMLGLSNKLQVPKWQKTEPIRLSTKLKLVVQENPIVPSLQARALIGQSILTYNNVTKKYIVPGISAHSLSDLENAKGKKGFIESSFAKLVSVNIPGVIFIPLAMVETATPTYSKERTESGYPLWIDIDLQVQSLYPATTEFFDKGIENAFHDFDIPLIKPIAADIVAGMVLGAV